MNKASKLAVIISVLLLFAALGAGPPAAEARADTNLVIQQPVGVTTTHAVSLGDSLELLAARYDLSATQLAHHNHIANPNLIYAGQSLSVPNGSAETGRNTTSVAKVGGLVSSAVQHGESLVELSIANSLRNPVITYSGQVIALNSDTQPDEASSDSGMSASIHPVPLEQGHSGGLHFRDQDTDSVAVQFNGRVTPLIQAGSEFVGVIGVDRWATPGIYPIAFQLEMNDGTTRYLERRVLVVAGMFQSEDIRLSSEVAQVLNDGQNVAEEGAYIAQVMSSFTPEIYWNALFHLPAAGVLTSTYGTSRLYNESTGVNLFHSGNDLAAQVGTPILAPADGTVVDIGELAIRGLVTVIDHGGGVYTGYWHQSAILVSEGEVVKAGQQIGAIGNTGLSTASHLHWEMWVGGVQVDSLQWVRESFP